MARYGINTSTRSYLLACLERRADCGEWVRQVFTMLILFWFSFTSLKFKTYFFVFALFSGCWWKKTSTVDNFFFLWTPFTLTWRCFLWFYKSKCFHVLVEVNPVLNSEMPSTTLFLFWSPQDCLIFLPTRLLDLGKEIFGWKQQIRTKTVTEPTVRFRRIFKGLPPL